MSARTTTRLNDTPTKLAIKAKTKQSVAEAG